MTDNSKTTQPENSQDNSSTDQDAAQAKATQPASDASVELGPPTAKAEPMASQAHTQQPAAPSRSGITGVFLALLALIGLAALAATGYLQMQAQQQQEFGLDQSLSHLRNTVAELEVDNKSRNQWFDAASDRSSKLDRQIQSLQQQQQGAEEQRERLQESVSQLAEQVQGGQMAWRKAEIQHLLLVANARAQLEKDLSGARTALELAAGRLADLADPAFYRVQEVVGKEIARLEATQAPDLQALALKLSALTDQVDALPMRQAKPGLFETELSLTSGPQNAAWHQRLWVSVREAVGSLVSIRRDEEKREPLLPPNQDFYLRQNLRLQLESARLAMLREDSANYQSALRQAEQWLLQYFDQSNAATKAALNSIQSLSSQNIQIQIPDISGSLKALRAIGASA